MDFLFIILSIAFLFIGLVTGFIAGLLGVGGGIIIVPISYFVLTNLGYSVNISMHVAIASSLGVIFFTSISSMLTHMKLNNIDFLVIKKWFLGIVTGSILGSIVGSQFDGRTLIIIFVIILLSLSFNMFFQRKFIIINNDLPKNRIINFFISLVIGFLSAIIGIGGGSFSVPILTMFSKKIHEAIGTSAVFGFFIAFPGAIIFMITGSLNENIPEYSIGYVNIIIVILVSITSIFTANIGAKVASKINKNNLRKVFAIFLLFTCVSLIIEHFII